MNDLDKLLKEVKENIYQEECVKEYFRLKKIIENDEELMLNEKEVRHHQKLMCQYKEDDEKYFKEKALYENYLNKLENNPIYQNFLEVKKEVNSLLLEIKDYLN